MVNSRHDSTVNRFLGGEVCVGADLTYDKLVDDAGHSLNSGGFKCKHRMIALYSRAS